MSGSPNFKYVSIANVFAERFFIILALNLFSGFNVIRKQCFLFSYPNTQHNSNIFPPDL